LEITKEQWGQWGAHPVTAAVRETVQGLRDCLDQMGWRQVVDKESADKTLANLSELDGQIKGIDFILEIDRETVIEATSKGEANELTEVVPGGE